MISDKRFNGRDVDDILNGVGPKKSATLYEKRWEEFMEFSKEKGPSEEIVIQFMDFLRQNKGYKTSSLWSSYSCLNSKYSFDVWNPVSIHASIDSTHEDLQPRVRKEDS